jgi:succinate dehydrogenase hydrophobic anchor subunit
MEGQNAGVLDSAIALTYLRDKVENQALGMAGKIFINYRRDDDPGFAQALFAHLARAFPPEQLFMDVDSIEPGLDFVRVLNDQVAQCDILISVVGKNWVDARDENGARRLDNPDDFVRIEIEAGLQHQKRVIPVLVGQAQMPRADQLPDTLKRFARHNAVRLTHERFRADTQALIISVQRALKVADESRAAKAQEEAVAQPKGKRRDGAFVGTIPRFARTIVEVLRQTRLTPDDRRRQQEVEAQARAEELRSRQEAEAMQRAEEQALRKKEEEDGSVCEPEDVKAQNGEQPSKREISLEQQSRETPASELWMSAFRITALSIYVGTVLFTWWLTAASIGPNSFSNVAWLTNSIWGMLVLTCYVLAGIIQSVGSIIRMIIRLKSKGQFGDVLHFEDIGALAALPLTICMGLLIAYLFDRNQAAVVQIVSSPIVAVLVLFFILSAAMQMLSGTNHVIGAALLDVPVRYLIKIINILCTTAITVIAIIALLRISFST